MYKKKKKTLVIKSLVEKGLNTEMGTAVPITRWLKKRPANDDGNEETGTRKE